ncbi:MAG: hypothetical protein WAO35_20385 [Terriglobia bacterium]
MNSKLKAEIVGASLLIPAWAGTFSSGVPTLYGPLPFITILPAFVLSNPRFPYSTEYIASLIPVVLFFLWNPGLLHEQSSVPKRTIAAAALLSALTVVYFAGSWHDGVKFQGGPYTLTIFIINFAWLALLWWLIVRCWRHPAFTTNLLSHWVLFAWLGWYAFPWLGELP